MRASLVTNETLNTIVRNKNNKDESNLNQEQILTKMTSTVSALSGSLSNLHSEETNFKGHSYDIKSRHEKQQQKSETSFRTKKSPDQLNLKILKKSSSQEHNEDVTRSSIISSDKTKKISLKFENLSYIVKAGLFSKEIKTILSEVNGHFKPGELTAIVGPSGAGKSTLLNILSGYINFNYSGTILVNGKPRDLNSFIMKSAYIKQDAELQPFLTVSEAMFFAANLKIGDEITNKKDRVKKLLQAIGMYEIRHTMTRKLSGGQKKRLSVALELVNNPPVLFLDEPTSGLDSVTSTQCISLLKKLALEGRTIILTIHQPSPLIFRMFDHLFAVAGGKCIYSGGTQNLVPFLSELNLKCPESHNPSDFLLEISTHDYGYENPRLTEKIQNGLCEMYRKTEQTTSENEAMNHVEKMMQSGLVTPIQTPHILNPNTPCCTTSKIFESFPQNGMSSSSSSPVIEVKLNKSTSSITNYTTQNPTIQKECFTKPKLPNLQIDPSKICKYKRNYATPFHRQLMILLMRTFLILWRDKSLTLMRVLLHALMGTFIGILYFGIGDDASNTLNIFRYIFFSIMFVMYTAFSSILLNFPLEIEMISREHFNRWYSLRAYYVAITLADFPVQFTSTAVFILISYYLTGQPMEFSRFFLFALMVVMSALVAQSIGLTVGASLNVTNAAIFGPFFLSPFLAFSGFFVQIKDVGQTMQWLFHVSFLKYSLEGSTLAIFGYNRPQLKCDDVFCMFVSPKRFLQEVCMDRSDYQFALFILFVIFVMLRILSFCIMSFRLRLFR